MKIQSKRILVESGWQQLLLSLAFLSMLLSFSGCQLPSTTQTADAAVAVGVRLQRYQDTQRLAWDGESPRPINLLIWYPAATGSAMQAEDIAIFKGELLASGAPLKASQQKFPLLVLSHGTGGSAASLAWFGRAMAARGYIVVGMNHHGNTGFEGEPRLEGFLTWWERPRDISVALDKLLADPEWRDKIDATRIALAGFSIGGYTVLANAGARADYPQWQARCKGQNSQANCQLPPEAKFSQTELEAMLVNNQALQRSLRHAGDDYRDPRVKAVFAMAPVMGMAMTVASLQQIQIPVYIIAVDKDDQALPGLISATYVRHIPGTSFELIPDYTHYSFLANCHWRGISFAPLYCLDPAGIKREQLHQNVIQQAYRFFASSGML